MGRQHIEVTNHCKFSWSPVFLGLSLLPSIYSSFSYCCKHLTNSVVHKVLPPEIGQFHAWSLWLLPPLWDLYEILFHVNIASGFLSNSHRVLKYGRVGFGQRINKSWKEFGQKSTLSVSLRLIWNVASLISLSGDILGSWTGDLPNDWLRFFKLIVK